MEQATLRRITRQRRLVDAAVAGSRAQPTAEWFVVRERILEFAGLCRDFREDGGERT